MKKYEIKKVGKDFKFIPEINNKGTRKKRTVLDNKGNKAFFKYEMYDKGCSEACSEKLSYEIAKILEYECAHIELALDENDEIRSQFYTLENIKKCVDMLNQDLFYQFLKIMVFDALVGEQDRHEENWGIMRINGEYKISPLYDNGCNLLREFRKEDFAIKYYDGLKDFDTYINKSNTLIYKENGKKYKHFELIEYLYNIYPNQIRKEIINLEKLTDSKIEDIVNKMPDNIITIKHKEYIIRYIKTRKKILLDIINR